MNNNYIILHNCYIKSFKFKLLNIKNSYYISNKEDTSNKNKTSISKIGKEIINLKFNANIISENTYIRDIGILNIIKKDIGNIAIQDITFNELQTFLNNQKNYSNSTIDKIFQLLNSIIKYAINNDLITKNPLNKVIKPKSNKITKKISAFTINEHKKFVNSLENNRKKYIFLIALNTGMRCGEILALSPQDINFKDKTIYIHKTLSKDKNGKPIISQKTKTLTSSRILPIEPQVENYLKEAIKNMVSNPNNLIFTKKDGGILRVSCINTEFKRICKKLKFKNNYNFHMLRHTYATRCIEAGMPSHILQKLLGHRDISTTINTYTTIFNKYTKSELKKVISYKQNHKLI